MRIISIILCIFIVTSSAFAQSTPDQSRTEQIQREQQQRIDEEFRKRELNEALKKPTIEQPKTEMPDMSSEGACIDIKSIEYVGNTVIENKKINTIVEKYTQRCVTISEINALLQEITNMYIDAGFVTSRTFMTMPQPRLREGVLELKIIEGKISAIEGLPAGKKFTAFPLLEEKVLNLRDIEQGLEQINRLQANGATLDIKPAEQESYSNVIIANSKTEATRLEHTLDNAGSEYTGKWRTGLRYMQDDILGLNDQLNFSYTRAMNKNYLHKDANALAVGLSVPLGYWSFNNNFSYSNSLSSFPLQVSRTLVHSSGESVNNTFSASRLMSRGQKYKLSFGTSVTYKDSKSYTEVYDVKTLNESASRSLALIGADIPATLYFNSGMAYLKPSYIRGTHWFGALDDSKTQYTQKAQYDVFKMYVYLAKKLWVGTLMSTIDGQYSNDELYGSESFYIGGEYSVRGFKNEGAQGDSGVTVRNDYEINLGSLLKKEFLIPWSFTLFMDYGYVNSNSENYESSSLSGIGGKLATQYKYFEASLAYAAITHKSDDILENAALYFSSAFVYTF